ncbi:DeoR family transcriptional regulator [Candidatus Parcubacteria bacterium]|nr:MAG: DeoR family transcriptional regulator [Candidatus Parcubacteria bacterium]
MNGPKENILLTKAFEISYATIRIAASIPNAKIREELEGIAFELLGFVANGEYGRAERKLSAEEHLVRLLGDTGMLNHRTVSILAREMRELVSGFANRQGKSEPEEVPIEKIFKAVAESSSEDRRKSGKTLPVSRGLIPGTGADSLDTSHGEFRKVGQEAFLREHDLKQGAKIRQSAIVDKVRQIGNCRLKDLEGLFPLTSERTIRYDLQHLTEQGVIERVGAGGPATYYRLRDAVQAGSQVLVTSQQEKSL